MTRMALSHPEVSFQFINNGQTKLHTAGNGKLRDVIYHVYGREIASNLLRAEYETSGLKITGFLGKPLISRGNRNFENYYINGRYVKSSIIAKAIEDGYKDFTMQHKYPFVVLHMEIDTENIDVNVHPTKMELRFNRQQEVYNAVYAAVDEGLHREELIPQVEVNVPKAQELPPVTISKKEEVPPVTVSKKEEVPPVTVSKKEELPPVTIPKKSELPPKEERDLNYFMEKMKERVTAYHNQNSSAEVKDKEKIFKPQIQADRIREAVQYAKKTELPESEPPKQMNLFEERLLSEQARARHKIIGQVFDTYWLVEFQDQLYIIDQHAAHERVLYERTLKEMKTREFTSQMISPPILLNLGMQEAQLLNEYMDQFTRIGFEIEEFGQDTYAVRAVPDNLFSLAKKDLLIEMLDSLSDELNRSMTAELIDEKVASMSCKAAVKGNMKLSAAEADALIGELLTLDNPYHCPHGRPTIISMTKRDLEKKFKRIV